jgi:hypothetical protein
MTIRKEEKRNMYRKIRKNSEEHGAHIKRKTGIRIRPFLPGSILFYQVELLIGKVDGMCVEQPHNVGFGECSL